MRKDTKEDPIIRRVIMTTKKLNGANKGDLCRILSYRPEYNCYKIKSSDDYAYAYEDDITDEFPVRITHYECIKDGKILLSSDEEIEVESIEEFKKNAHKLITCDEIKLTYKAEQR